LHRFYIDRADVVIAVSSDLAAEAAEVHGIPSERTLVIPNGRDADLFKPSESRRPGPPRLIFVGHLDAGKRPQLFIELVGELRRRGLELEAAVVGEGYLADVIQASADAAGVSMLGRRDDVPALLADSDLLVMTSRPPEGMPGVLIEAGLSGVAAVSSRTPGSGDVIDDGVTGILVDVDDFGALVGAVERLLIDESERRAMGRRARNRCLERFTLSATADQWRSVLTNLTGRTKLQG
jgi:glycosyltransferase involved in cell wall biosynthesis